MWDKLLVTDPSLQAKVISRGAFSCNVSGGNVEQGVVDDTRTRVEEVGQWWPQRES
jgi:hypothetical protein